MMWLNNASTSPFSALLVFTSYSCSLTSSSSFSLNICSFSLSIVSLFFFSFSSFMTSAVWLWKYTLTSRPSPSPSGQLLLSLPLVSLRWRCCLSAAVQNKHTTFSPGSWFMQNTAPLREWKFTHKTFFQQQDSRGNLIRIFKDMP